MERVTPLGAVARGLMAGVVGTAAMTAVQELSARLPSEGGSDSNQDADNHSSHQADPWEEASAPAKVARRFIEGVLDKTVPPDAIPLLTHATHWAYGTGWGAVFGLVQGTRKGAGLRRGLLFGTAVWGMSYVQLVPMGLYEPPWRYPLKDVALEIGYHLAYGAGVGLAYSALATR